MADPLLDVRDLRVTFHADTGSVRAVDGVSFTLGEDEVLGIVGESGSGKSVSMMSVMRLLDEQAARARGRGPLRRPRPARALAGRHAGRPRLADRDGLPGPDELAEPGLHRRLAARGADPRAPAARRGRRARARRSSCSRAVGIPEPERRVDDYPHQFSGGMRQRVMIAMALSCDPRVLIADEPTTALDVTIQAQILELIGALRSGRGSSVVLITHDMGVVAGIADRDARHVRGPRDRAGPDARGVPRPAAPVHVEPARLDPAAGPAAAAAALTAIPGAPPTATEPATGCVFAARCPHRFALCDELPPLSRAARAGPPRRLPPAADGPARPCDRTRMSDVLLRATGLHKHFPVRADGLLRRETGSVRAVDGVDLEVHAGRDARARRRVGLRQVDARARPAPAPRPDGGHDRVRRARHLHARPRARCARSGATCR